MELERVFKELYATKAWGDGFRVPLSGGGSDPDIASPYVDFVKHVISNQGIKSVVDLGHGDWAMWRDYRFPEVDYFGIDIVPEISDRNTKLYGTPKTKFMSGNILEMDLPKADLLISKEVLQHLSNQHVTEVLRKLRKFQFLILSNAIHINSSVARMKYLPARLGVRGRVSAVKEQKNPFYLVRRLNNLDIEDGYWRALDLEQDPFRSLLREWRLENKFIYPGSNYKGVNQAVYFYCR